MTDYPDEIDRDLTSKEVMDLSPKNKALRSTMIVTRKVELLELWTRDLTEFKRNAHLIPWKRPALRAWKDVERRLWPWKDANVDSYDGNQKDLMKRYDATLPLLRKLVEKNIRDYEGELSAKDLIIENLVRQNVDLMDALANLQRSLRA